MKYTSVVEDYFQNVIKKSWTWNKLTEEEQKRFIDMDIFDKIKGNDQTRVEWLNTIYYSFLFALGYKPVGWRETEEKKARAKKDLVALRQDGRLTNFNEGSTYLCMLSGENYILLDVSMNKELFDKYFELKEE